MSRSASTPKVVVIGAGVGGLTAAAALARAGVDVTVLEAQVYLGGCAGTFYHQGYRFDTGATLAGGFNPGGPMELVAQVAGVESWPAHPADPAMVVHMPDGYAITRYGDERRWAERLRAFGKNSENFWLWQEKTADAMWDLALRIPPWPPQSPTQLLDLAAKGMGWLADGLPTKISPALLADAFSTVSSHLRDQSSSLRLFIDAQLLISAQTTSRYANALYGASALDLPRRGVVHLEGGMEAVARSLADSLTKNGGRIILRQEASRIIFHQGKTLGVETKKGDFFPAQVVIANLPPTNIDILLGNDDQPKLPPEPAYGWGAFMVYMGVDESVIPPDFPLHHQIIRREPLGETNTVFLSASPDWDASRAPEGKRALTLSTHTDLQAWWQLYHNDLDRYESRKQEYLEAMLQSAELVLPGISQSSSLIMPGTPVTFQKFTRRLWGWVGGFPQTSLFRLQRPRLAPGVWMVGDSIFPGQSMPAVALGGLRVAGLVLRDELAPRRANMGYRYESGAHQTSSSG